MIFQMLNVVLFIVRWIKVCFFLLSFKKRFKIFVIGCKIGQIFFVVWTNGDWIQFIIEFFPAEGTIAKFHVGDSFCTINGTRQLLEYPADAFTFVHGI